MEWREGCQAKLGSHRVSCDSYSYPMSLVGFYWKWFSTAHNAVFLKKIFQWDLAALHDALWCTLDPWRQAMHLQLTLSPCPLDWCRLLIYYFAQIFCQGLFLDSIAGSEKPTEDTYTAIQVAQQLFIRGPDVTLGRTIVTDLFTANKHSTMCRNWLCGKTSSNFLLTKMVFCISHGQRLLCPLLLCSVQCKKIETHLPFPTTHYWSLFSTS